MQKSVFGFLNTVRCGLIPGTEIVPRFRYSPQACACGTPLRGMGLTEIPKPENLADMPGMAQCDLTTVSARSTTDYAHSNNYRRESRVFCLHP
jgi:hypothetical protein